VGVAGDWLLTIVLVGVAVAAPLEVGFAAVVVGWLLVPGQLVVPHLPHVVLVDRVVLYSFLGRLLWRVDRPGEAPGRAFALTPLHGAFGLLLVAAFVDGSVVIPRGASLAAGLHAWLALVDLAVLFVATLAVARTIGLWRTVRVVVGVLLVAVGIGLVERATGHGWSRFFFEGLPYKDLADGSAPLATRNGHVRSQGAAQFALEYGWVLAVLCPLLVVAVRRWATRRRLAGALGGLAVVALGLAVAFSSSRSALVAVAAGLGLLVVVAADRRLVAAGLALAALGAVAVAIHPALVTGPFTSGNLTDPLSVRTERLPVLFSLVANRPWQGIGYFGATSAYGGLDDAYALMYANIGMVGALAYCAVLGTALVASLRALRAPRGSETRLVGAACAVGVLGLIVALAVYDGASTTQTPWAIAVLGAVGTAAGELAGHRPLASRRWLLRAVLPLMGVGLGVGLAVTAPVTVAESFTVFTGAPYVDAYAGNPVSQFTGATLANTLCGLVTGDAVRSPHTQVQCTPQSDVVVYGYPGTVDVTVRGPTAAAVTAEARRAFTPAFDTMYMTGGVSSPMHQGRPAWAVTAPLWAGAVGAGLALAVPAVPVAGVLRRGRRRTRAEGTRLGAASTTVRSGLAPVGPSSVTA
jgi:hypothetical protein